MSILQTIDLKVLRTKLNITRALDGVNLSVGKKEFVVVVGTSGSVIVREQELAKKNDKEQAIFRRHNIGFIFQNYNLVPILNVYENIVLPVKLDGDTIDQRLMDEIVDIIEDSKIVG